MNEAQVSEFVIYDKWIKVGKANQPWNNLLYAYCDKHLLWQVMGHFFEFLSTTSHI